MSTKPNPDNRLSELARLDALESATFPDRIARALRLMGGYNSPLQVSSGTGPGGTSDHDEPPSDDRSRSDRQELVRLVLRREQMARGISRILNDWAPIPTKGKAGDTENSAMWCVNHLKHGEREPTNGRGRNCRWCQEWKKRLNLMGLGKDTWPNKEMIDLNARGIKITETIARRSLKNSAA